jgi:hypothetical protein
VVESNKFRSALTHTVSTPESTMKTADEIAMKFQSVDLNNGPLEHDYRPPISRQNSMNGGRFSRQNSSRSDEM